MGSNLPPRPRLTAGMKRIAYVLLAALAACRAAPAAKSAPAAASSAAPAPAATVVDGRGARQLVAAGVKVVDVRTPEEFARGHVPGAVNVPYDQMADRAQELGSPSTPLLLYCHSGRRSGIAIETLREKGFTRLYDMKTYDAWVEADRAEAGR
jgi:phage shock protein E